MGCGLGSRYRYYDYGYTPNPPPNPNPKNFQIQDIVEFSSKVSPTYCVVKVRYPDATNYEGLKVLVYKTDKNTILKRKSLDPHFSKKELSPIARFEPTDFGWACAISFVELLLNKQLQNTIVKNTLKNSGKK